LEATFAQFNNLFSLKISNSLIENSFENNENVSIFNFIRIFIRRKNNITGWKPVSFKQIAEQLNISVTTVSKSLKDYPDISKKTKALVSRIGPNP